MDRLVSTEWLAGELGAGDLVVLDATKHRATSPRDPLPDYRAGHIPGALFFDHRMVTDKASAVPTALPRADQFADYVGSLGIGNDTRVVIYDDSDVKTSSRAWYMFHMFGAERVALLDGGIAKWKAEGRPLETDTPVRAPAEFRPRPREGIVRFKQDMLANIESGSEQVIDTRLQENFTGAVRADPEVPSGHIPGSSNLPFPQFYNEDGTFRSDDELRAAIEANGHGLVAPGDRDMRRGRDGGDPGLHPAPAGERGRGALRRQLERVGRRPRHAEGYAASWASCRRSWRPCARRLRHMRGRRDRGTAGVFHPPVSAGAPG